jgi:hypothetical protein
MARYVMVLRGATSIRGALEGVGPENRDFFGPCLVLGWMDHRLLWLVCKVRFQLFKKKFDFFEFS